MSQPPCSPQSINRGERTAEPSLISSNHPFPLGISLAIDFFLDCLPASSTKPTIEATPELAVRSRRCASTSSFYRPSRASRGGLSAANFKIFSRSTSPESAKLSSMPSPIDIGVYLGGTRVSLRISGPLYCFLASTVAVVRVLAGVNHRGTWSPA